MLAPFNRKTEPKPEPKPEPKQEPKPTPKIAPPTKRVRASRLANNSYLVVVDSYTSPPNATEVVARGVSLVEAQQLVRAFWLEQLGLDGYADSGL
jgi:outer membrane biosynthesis protein TonB